MTGAPRAVPLRIALPRLLGTATILLAALFGLYQAGMNLHASAGIPYWDDWRYFFGAAQGLHVPLSLESLFAKEADYVVPFLRLLTRGLWLVFGADFIAFRFIGWALFATMLVILFRLVLRAHRPPGGWTAVPLALSVFVLLSVANQEYFFLQYMALSQPVFFIAFFLYLHFSARRRLLPALACLLVFGTFGVFGIGYLLGTVAFAVALATTTLLGGAPLRTVLADRRLMVEVPVGVALILGIGTLTFAGSYANHTGQALVGPWTVDFWIFLASAFAAAVGFSPEMPGRLYLPLGALGFALYAGPLLLMLARRWRDAAWEADAGRDAGRDGGDFVLGGLLAGTIVVIAMTGGGRAHLCGLDLQALKNCGATPRYVYPVILALPAVLVAWWRLLPDPRGGWAWRSGARAGGIGVVLLAAVGFLTDAALAPTLKRWDFAPLNRTLATRDAASRDCLTGYLAQALPAAAGKEADWSQPLYCPNLWGAADLAPYLKVAHDTGAAFLPPLLADLDSRRRRPSVLPLLRTASVRPDGTLTGALVPDAEAAAGYLDRAVTALDGTPTVLGWAVDRENRRPAAAVVVLLDGRIVAVGEPGEARPDVAAAFKEPGYADSGFVVALPRAAVAGGGTVRVIAVTQAYKTATLTGEATLAPAGGSPAPGQPAPAGGSRIVPATEPTGYLDARPAAYFRLDARDHGPVLRHGGGPDGSDRYGARDAWVFRDGDTYYMHYDAAGPEGWRAALAVSGDGVTFEPKGPVLDLGRPGEDDSASASYGTTYFDGRRWHMFYLGTPNATSAPDRVPAFPYLTMKAEADGPAGPWRKRPDVVPFRTRPGTHYNNTASPGQVVRHGDQYLQFFSAGEPRTIGLARTRDLDGPWTVDERPILPPGEQIENASLHFQEETGTWFLFTNHVGLRDGVEFTDAIWVYWTQDIERWNPADKAVVLDGRNATWSKTVIGLPSVLRIGDRLAIYYDGLAQANEAGDRFSHMRRDVGLAWLDLPIALPEPGAGPAAEPRLLDAFDAVERAPALPPAAVGTDTHCVLDTAERSRGGGLTLRGWSVVSGRDGVAPDAVLAVLTPEAKGETSGEPVYIRARREPRPDVKRHFGQPAMAEPGYAALADVRGLRGAYRLDLVQLYGGSAYPCALGRPLTLD